MPQDVVVTVDHIVEVSGDHFAITSSVPVVSVITWFTVTATPIVQIIENEILKVGPPVYCTVL